MWILFTFIRWKQLIKQFILIVASELHPIFVCLFVWCHCCNGACTFACAMHISKFSFSHTARMCACVQVKKLNFAVIKMHASTYTHIRFNVNFIKMCRQNLVLSLNCRHFVTIIIHFVYQILIKCQMFAHVTFIHQVNSQLATTFNWLACVSICLVFLVTSRCFNNNIDTFVIIRCEWHTHTHIILSLSTDAIISTKHNSKRRNKQ